MFAKFDLNPSRIFFSLSLFFICGIFIASHWPKGWVYLPLFLILAIFPFLFLEKKKATIFACFPILFFLGMARFFMAENVQLLPAGGEIEGIVIDGPKEGKNSSSFVLKSESGKILIITEKGSGIKECDNLRIIGETSSPEKDFRGFLAKDRIYAISFFPAIELLGKDRCNSFLANFRSRAGGEIKSKFPDPQASILRAMLLGEKRDISEAWQSKLSVTGVRHITAVSGMHVAVVGFIFLSIAVAFGLQKKHASAAALLGILLFIFMTGAQPSAIRAGIMGGAALLAQLLGRKSSSLRILVLAATIMLFFNPFLLRYDIGFRLSFAAVSGIILFSPFLEKIFKFLPKVAREITATSFAANIFVFPLLGYHFGEVSIVFPLTNLLILPILYWLMFLGITFVFLSLFSGFMAALIYLPLWGLLTYLIGIVGFFSTFPLASIEMTTGLFVLYFFLLFYLIKKRKENMEKESYRPYGF